MNKAIKSLLRPIVRPLMSLGLKPFALASLRYYPKYQRQSREFKQKGGEITHRYPILTDYIDQAGSASGHYFHQDLLVASFIHTNNPERHVDVGSRVDGFVAHVAAFRPIEILDIRPLAHTGHNNIRFLQADLMSDKEDFPAADSVSCLHAIEHFGLGRYNDPINPEGYKRGFKNLLKMVQPNGYLYISFPIGKRNEVHFNAHRVFHPLDIFKWTEDSSIELKRFDYVDDKGVLHQSVDLFRQPIDVSWGCGIYTFQKL